MLRRSLWRCVAPCGTSTPGGRMSVRPSANAALITQQDFECGHVVSRAMGGATILDNLLPICRSCNRSMGTTDMRVFKETYFRRNADPMDVD
eukprot:gene17333-23642_t